MLQDQFLNQASDHLVVYYLIFVFNFALFIFIFFRHLMGVYIRMFEVCIDSIFILDKILTYLQKHWVDHFLFQFRTLEEFFHDFLNQFRNYFWLFNISQILEQITPSFKLFIINLAVQLRFL